MRRGLLDHHTIADGQVGRPGGGEAVGTLAGAAHESDVTGFQDREVSDDVLDGRSGSEVDEQLPPRQAGQLGGGLVDPVPELAVVDAAGRSDEGGERGVDGPAGWKWRATSRSRDQWAGLGRTTRPEVGNHESRGVERKHQMRLALPHLPAK